MEYKFIILPISLMKGFFEKKEETINRMLNFGIYNLIQKVNSNLEYVATQLMYDYYRNKGNLSMFLLDRMQMYIDSGQLQIDDDYNGFAGNEFQPDFELESLIPILEKDNEFRLKAIEHTVSKHVFSKSGITASAEYISEQGKEIEKTIEPKEAKTSIDFDFLYDYRDNEKTEKQLVQLAAFMAIKSILGTKNYCRTTKNMILSRMFGYTKPQKEIKHPLYEKYSIRYHFSKLMDELSTHWKINHYSYHMRGFYITQKMSIEKLIEIAETNKNKSKIMREQKRAIREKVLRTLKNE